jgi:hypothetical protein
MPADPSDKSDRAVPGGSIGEHRIGSSGPVRKLEEFWRPHDFFPSGLHAIAVRGVRRMNRGGF